MSSGAAQPERFDIARERYWLAQCRRQRAIDSACDSASDYLQEIDQLRAEKAELREENTRLRQRADDASHVIVESGVAPGRTGLCRCEQCRRVAVAMAEAGYLQFVEPWERWWEQPSPPAPLPRGEGRKTEGTIGNE